MRCCRLGTKAAKHTAGIVQDNAHSKWTKRQEGKVFQHFIPSQWNKAVVILSQ